MPSSLSLFRLFFLVALALALTGCETTRTHKKLNSLKENFVVTRGMSAAELVENLGEPDFKHPLAEYSVEAVVWAYHREVATDAEMVITDTQRQFYWDPVRRVVVELDVPVLQPQVSVIVEVTEILMVADKVYSWKREVSERRDIEGLTR